MEEAPPSRTPASALVALLVLNSFAFLGSVHIPFNVNFFKKNYINSFLKENRIRLVMDQTNLGSDAMGPGI